MSVFYFTVAVIYFTVTHLLTQRRERDNTSFL
jgi:hypothetical protein